MLSTVESNKILFWSGGVKSTALALMMIEAGEGFDVVHIRKMWDQETPLEIPQQVEWKKDFLKKFGDRKIHIVDFKTAKELSEERIPTRGHMTARYLMQNHPYGAMMFEQTDRGVCSYNHYIVKEMRHISREIIEQGGYVIYGTADGESSQYTKYRNAVVHEQVMEPLKYYQITRKDCERLLSNYGVEIPFNHCMLCPYITKQDKDKLYKFVPNACEIVGEWLRHGNPDWVDDCVALRTGWFNECFNINEYDYPLRYNKWICSKSRKRPARDEKEILI